MLVLSRKPNQSIQIGDHITVSVVRIKGNVIQLGIEAPRDVHIARSELLGKEPVQRSDKKPEAAAGDAAEQEADRQELPLVSVVRTLGEKFPFVTAV